jgi:hypothetical protein
VLAGGPQLGGQLGGEQVHLGFQVELALAVDDDFLDERAVPAGSSTVATWMPCSR